MRFPKTMVTTLAVTTLFSTLLPTIAAAQTPADAIPLPSTGSTTIDHVIVLVTALSTLLSALASLLNHFVRQKTSSGEAPSKMLLSVTSAANVGALNVDKAVQLVQIMRGKDVAHTGVVVEDDAAGDDAAK